MLDDTLIQAALDAGFHATALVDTSEITFDPAFRPFCEKNLCGQYGANYSCPPSCGSPEEMRARVLAYKRAAVLQTLWDISDYSDWNVIQRAKTGHNAAENRFARWMEGEGRPGLLVGASGCTLCDPCAARERKPCPFPGRRYSCMSAYCVYVRGLAERCGMEYFREGKLALFGMYVFDPK